MKQLTLYLDTSVISHLDAADVPEKMEETHRLWREIESGKYRAVMSDVTLAELDGCADDKRERLAQYLERIPFQVVQTDEQVTRIARKFIELGVLRPKSYDDCQHIAAAIVSGCDIIVSWNFKHIVNHKTIQGARAITALEGFDDVLIYPPSILVGGESE